jgi:hypothetical protein
MIAWQGKINRKGFGRKQSWFILKYRLGVSQESLRKTVENLRVVGVSDTSHKLDCYSQLLF